MGNNSIIWMEVGFNLLYLILIWGLVVLMRVRFDRVKEGQKNIANLFWVALFTLAFGDTFHVGTRTVAYFLDGGLAASVSLFGASVGIVGWSALVTSVTVTIFYLFLLVIWIIRNQERVSAFVYLLFTVAGIRLGLLVLPENQWGQPVPVQPWSMVRNIPLFVLGVGVGVLFLWTAVAKKDRTYIWVGILILFSFLTYLPVVIFVQAVPLLGMLMIPKTIAYLGIGWLFYRSLYGEQRIPTGTGD